MNRINELARFCNLQVVGTRGVWWVRKSATSPVTRKEYFFKRSTKTADLRTAVIRAMPMVEGFLARITNPLGPTAAVSGECVTLGELFTAYELAPTVEASLPTRKKNVAAVKRMVRLIHGDDFNVEGASSRVISKQLVKDYQSRRLMAARLEHRDDLAAVESAKRGINSALKQAQSLFSREAMDDYGQMSLPATVMEFAKALPVPARAAEEPVQLPDELVAGMVRAMAAHKAVDLPVWSTFQLFVWAGLRNIECNHARIGWLEELPGGYRLQLKADGDFIPKGRSTSRVMPKPIVEELLAAVPLEDGVDRKTQHLVPAINKTDRHDAIYRRLNAWLREQGVSEDANKIAYRLRKYFFKKVEEQQGMLLALAAHGGGDLNTLTNHYTGRQKMAEPIKLAT